jgi:hypothetical protein
LSRSEPVEDNLPMRVLLAVAAAVALVAVTDAAGGREVVGACRAGDLAASVFFQGATGNLLGGFTVRNRSSHACRIGGRPGLALRRADGQRVTLTLLPADRRLPSRHAVRVLAPAGRATAWILWESYCGSAARGPFTFRATLTTRAHVSASTAAATGVRCSGRDGARLALTAFEAGT